MFQDKCNITESGRVNDQTSFFFSQGGCGGETNEKSAVKRNVSFLIGS